MLRRAVNAFLRLVLACAVERRGQVALTFGLSALPALIMVGSAVDYSRAVTQRSNLQQATDSTVLAMAHSYLTPSATCASLYGPTQTYLTGTMNASAAASVSQSGVAAACAGAGAIVVPSAVGVATLQSIIISQNNTQMCIKTTMMVSTQVMTIVNIPTMTVGAYSCSQVGGTYEIALVMDNSYSMYDSAGSGTKMQAAQAAATSLVQTLIPTGTTAPTSAISIVPFNALVNVGTTVGTSTPPAFMDTSGSSSLNWRTIAKPTWKTNPSKFDLFNTLLESDGKTPVPWGGCVEERPNDLNSSLADQTNYLTSDIAATSGDSLFVPYFAPDDPGGLNAAPNQNFYNFSCEFYPNTNTCSINNVSNYTSYLNSYIVDKGANANAGLPYCATADFTADNKASTNPGGGMTMACKYKNYKTNISTSTSNGTSQWFGLDASPNSNCTTPALTPLTTNQTTLINAINAMTPTGLTNLGTGFMWGWRTISGLTTPFFPVSSTTVTTPVPIGPKNPVPYSFKGPPPNTKVIILMTDGENSWAPFILSDNNNYGISNPYISSYEAFGFMTENRLSNYSTTCSTTSTPITGSGFVSNQTTTTNANGNWAAYRCQMDNMLLEACTNAKNAGITVYTVGFATTSDPISAEGQAVLQNCASSLNKYFAPANSSDIVNSFQQIAASIANLRLSQ